MIKHFYLSCLLLIYFTSQNPLIASTLEEEVVVKKLTRICQECQPEPDRARVEISKILSKKFKELWEEKYEVDYITHYLLEEDRINARTLGIPFYIGMFGISCALSDEDENFTHRKGSAPELAKSRLDHLLKVSMGVYAEIKAGKFDPPLKEQQQPTEKTP